VSPVLCTNLRCALRCASAATFIDRVSRHHSWLSVRLFYSNFYSNWPVCADVFGHPPPRLVSRRPIWLDMTSLDTILRSGERTGRRLLWSTTPLLPILLCDSQVSISLVIYCLLRTVSGQVKIHVLLTCTNAVSPNHLPVIVASDRP